MCICTSYYFLKGDIKMAWYAELKRRKWYCINGIDMIYIYRKKLYDDWYNSLTEEQKNY